MPSGDGTGPAGMGPMTGRAAGFCAGYGVPGYSNPIPGRGYRGFGRGRAWGAGRGWGRGRFAAPYFGGYGSYPVAPYGSYYGAPSPESESSFLKQQAEGLQAELDAVQKRLEELEKSAGSKGDE